MTFPTEQTLKDLSLPYRRTGWFHPNDKKADQWMRKLKREGVQQPTDSFEYSRADNIPEVTFLQRGATKSLTPTNVTLVSHKFERIGIHQEMDTYDCISGRGVEQMEVQERASKLGIKRELSFQLIEGIASPNILGIKFLSAGNTIGAANGNPNGGFMTLQDLYKLLYLVKVTDDDIGCGMADCLVGNNMAIRETLGLLDQAGERAVWSYDEVLGCNVLLFCNIPFYLSDSIPNNETKGNGMNLTSVYACKMSGPNGLKLLYAVDPNNPPDEWGCHVSHIPIQQTIDKKLSAIEAFYTLVCPESCTVARLDGVDPTQFALA